MNKLSVKNLNTWHVYEYTYRSFRMISQFQIFEAKNTLVSGILTFLVKPADVANGAHTAAHRTVKTIEAHVYCKLLGKFSIDQGCV